jgi:Cft2 family RNA processing exonuclease
MKKLTLFIAFLTGISVSGFTQKTDRRPFTTDEMAQRKTDRMKTELGLNEDQYKKVLEINTSMAKERETLRNTHREAFIKQQESLDKELASVLTKEQMEKREIRKKDVRNRMEARRGQFRGKNQGAFRGDSCQNECCKRGAEGSRKGKGRR